MSNFGAPSALRQLTIGAGDALGSISSKLFLEKSASRRRHLPNSTIAPESRANRKLNQKKEPIGPSVGFWEVAGTGLLINALVLTDRVCIVAEMLRVRQERSSAVILSKSGSDLGLVSAVRGPLEHEERAVSPVKVQ